MKFKITITKDVIDKSLMCGFGANNNFATGCAFAVAYNELVPCKVDQGFITFICKESLSRIPYTSEQKTFIHKFDSMCYSDNPDDALKRYTLVGQTFDVEIPDAVIEYWHGDAVTAAQKLIDNPIMQLVS